MNPPDNIPETFPGSLSNVSKRIQIIEVSVFLLLIVPSMVLSFFIVKPEAIGFSLTAVATILRDLALIALIFFFVWRNKEPVSCLGLKMDGLFKEVIVGVIFFFPLFYSASMIDSFLMSIGFHSPSMPVPDLMIKNNWEQIVLAVVLVSVVAFAEETIFRGYLLLRFQKLWKNPVTAVVASSFIFSLGHGYEGSAGVITVGFIGAFLAVMYLWRKSLIAPMIMHFLQDFVSIILIGLYGAK